MTGTEAGIGEIRNRFTSLSNGSPHVPKAKVTSSDIFQIMVRSDKEAPTVDIWI